MNKQEPAKSHLQRNVDGSRMMEDRYYVQRLTEQVFLIRERMSVHGKPGPDDRIVRSFAIRHDAYSFADNANDMQRKLDEQYGRWTQRAL